MNAINSSIKRTLTRIGHLTAICFYCACITTVTQATEFTVPDDHPTIQAAIDAASPGDTIFVNPGTYPENVDFTGKAVSLQSTEGPDVTIIEPSGGTAVSLGPNGEISGFTIRNGQASFGAGMSVHGSGSRIVQNIFDSNHQGSGGYGAAIGGNSASPVIDQNLFLNNTCDGQWLSGVVSFINSSSPRIVNNVFVDNPCRAINFTLPSSGMPLTINNTMVRNRVGIRVDRRIASSQQIYRNNIIVDNDIGLEVDFGTEAYNPTWEYNLVYNNVVDYDVILDQTGMYGNISADPLFADSPGYDFRLLGGSPAIDTGSSAGAPTNDFEGDVRPVDGDGDSVPEFDIGADEFAFGITISIVGGSVQECSMFGGSRISVAVTPYPPSVIISSIEWFLDGVSVASLPAPEISVPIGEHLLEVEAITSDGQVLIASAPVQIVDTVGPEIIAAFVDKRTGQEVSSIETNRMERVLTSIEVTDVCEEAPMYHATIGVSAQNGGLLKIKAGKNSVQLDTEQLELAVTAQDTAGNVSESVVTLQIVD